MMAYCGLHCDKCPTYLATQSDDHSAREKVAVQWSKFFGMTLTAKHINCDGCQSGSSRMFNYCKQCKLKSCCEDKGHKSCAECEEYPCEDLAGFFTLMPDARKGLEAIRKEMS